MSTVFWSWQSDLDARVTRDVVRDALAQAIEDLHAELEERHELTSDTKGVPGSPDIVATILAKIEAAAVFVGDVTPIAVTNSGKPVANPNVLIELGYAKKAIGLERIILVWNTAFEGAVPERLPFDLRGRRAPISFHLPIGATKAALGTAREGLRAIFTEALRGSLAISVDMTPQTAPEWQKSNRLDGLWFDASQLLLVNEDGVAGKKRVSPERRFYIRILPSAWTVPKNFAQSNHGPLLGPTQGCSRGTTKGGFLTFSGSIRADKQIPLTKMTLQFRATGELWAVDALLTPQDSQQYFYADYVIMAWNDFIAEAIPYLQSQGATGPFKVRMGAVMLDGLQWFSDTRWGGQPQALDDNIEVGFSLTSGAKEERLDALGTAWGEIAAAFGVVPPDRATLLRQIGV